MHVACDCLNVKIHLKDGPFVARSEWGALFYEGSAGIGGRKEDWGALMDSEDYSPAFRLVIMRRRPEGLDTHSGDFLSGVASSLDQSTDKYLRQEEVNVEERIRQYAEIQRKSLEGIKQRAHCDKKRLIGSLRSVTEDESELMESTTTPFDEPVAFAVPASELTPPMTPKDNSKNEEPDKVDDHLQRTAAMFDEPPDTLGPLPSPTDILDRGEMRGKLRRRSSGGGSASRLGSSLDTEGLFFFDGMEDSVLDPGTQGLVEEHSEDNTVDEDDLEDAEVDDPFPSIGAQSLPIKMPLREFRNQVTGAKQRNAMDMDAESPGVAPENIAASIQALARSVHMTEEDQFLMDLPRRRLRSFKDSIYDL
ncbi:unnamed protein product [Notodromas monacha]|uniref:AKT1 substrate 1 n=1 Tax=Notodromas monacha TaxID=399045 RepID=A0A7R9BQN8_9CRUS|nr:unnamed protein product [Notodromas monacha]CAG0918545.1 unnamed protein product [Notodromas monacha]